MKKIWLLLLPLLLITFVSAADVGIDSLEYGYIHPTESNVIIYNNSIPINLTIFNNTATGNVSACWYNVENDTAIVISNTTIANCIVGVTNFTMSLPALYDYTNQTHYMINIFINDTSNAGDNYGSERYIYVSRPSSAATYPTNGSTHEYNHSNLVIPATIGVEDIAGLDTCQVWGNWTGAWHKNQTVTFGGNTTGSVQFNISVDRGNYLWNTWCNNTYSVSHWGDITSEGNWTFTVADTVYPDINISLYRLFTLTTGQSIFGYTCSGSFCNICSTKYYHATGSALCSGLTPTDYDIFNYKNPTEQYYETNIIPLNFTFTETNPSSCWYQVLNYTDKNVVISKTIINNSLGTKQTCNTTMTLPYDGLFEVQVGVNDTTNANCTSNSEYCWGRIKFGVATTAPAVVLNWPTNDKNFNVANIYFNATATSTVGLDTCELWGNWSGWSKKYTWHPTSGIQFNTLISGIPANQQFIWNIWCNATDGKSKWAIENYTLTTDTIIPTASISSPAAGSEQTSLVFTLGYTITDANLDVCYFTLRDSLGALHNYAENTSLDCTLTSRYLAVLSEGAYTVYITGKDKAGNEITTSSAFTVVIPEEGGGGSTTLQPSANLTWHIYVKDNPALKKLVYSGYPGRSMSDILYFINDDVEDIFINIYCEGIFCDYITYSEENITLPVMRETSVTTKFTLTLPDDIIIDPDKIYTTNIVAMDQNGMIDIVTIEVSGGVFASIIKIIGKLGSSKIILGLPVPYVIISLFTAALAFTLFNYGLFKGIHGNKAILSIVLGGLVGLLPLVFI